MDNNKYLLSMMVAKRVKELKEGAKPLVEPKKKKPIIIALEEIKAGKVYLKEKEEPLKAEQIFNEDEKPEKVIFVIITDGEENASREFNRDQIMEMINRHKDENKWEFVLSGLIKMLFRLAEEWELEPQVP